MRLLFAGVLLMAGCALMAATVVDKETGEAMFTTETRSAKAAGCVMAIAALLVVGSDSGRPRDSFITNYHYYSGPPRLYEAPDEQTDAPAP